jgi:hypothetical protein
MKFKVSRGDFNQMVYRAVLKTYFQALVEATPDDLDASELNKLSDGWDSHMLSDGGVEIFHPNKMSVLKLENGWSGMIIRPKTKKTITKL